MCKHLNGWNSDTEETKTHSFVNKYCWKMPRKHKRKSEHSLEQIIQWEVCYIQLDKTRDIVTVSGKDYVSRSKCTKNYYYFHEPPKEGILSTLSDLFKTMCYWKPLWATGALFSLELKKKKRGFRIRLQSGNSLPPSPRKAKSVTPTSNVTRSG